MEVKLCFLSIPELFSIALSDENTYKKVDNELKKVEKTSVYEGVNRELYEKGGVALTSEALRAKALEDDKDTDYEMGTLPIVFWGITAGFAVATVVSSAVTASLNKTLAGMSQTISSNTTMYSTTMANLQTQQAALQALEKTSKLTSISENTLKATQAQMDKVGQEVLELTKKASDLKNNTAMTETAMDSVNSSIGVSQFLAVGAAMITVIMTVFSTLTTVLDASEYYDTEYTPIPKYMVDKADITTINDEGEEVMIKNETAYYRVVECNRTGGDSKITRKNFEVMETRNDLNGDIGKQWLALYAVKYRGGTPILADSLLYQKESSTVPEGYSTGIHEFGGKAATNLNNKKYLFPDNPPVVKVFFKTEKKTVDQLTGTGSVFGNGTVAISGGFGLILGALLGGLFMGRRKKKEKVK